MGAFEFFYGVQDNQSLVALTVLVVLDLATGVWSTKNTGEPITSRRLFKTAVKWFVYLTLVAAAHLAETVVPGVSFVDESMLSFLALTELVSIMENVGKMGYTMPQKLLGMLRQKKESL